MTPIDLLFVSGFGPIVRTPGASRSLYGDLFGIPFEEETGGYLHTEALDGAKTFALWPLDQAAESCFGTEAWPEGIAVPQAWIEFDVENVEMATAKAEAAGHTMLVKCRTEPWGQTVSRFLSPEGLLVGLTHTPSMRSPG
ncbi:MAG TPA: VOC family protein [Caulobacteraceae bacterium]|jgi:predicted enzyme related to lactoylglutathione lyase